MIELTSPIVIGIAGGSGSGKATVAQEILARMGADHIAFLPHDACHRDFGNLSFSEWATINFDHPDSLETSLLIGHVQRLKAGNSIALPVYDFKNPFLYFQNHPRGTSASDLGGWDSDFAEPELRKLFDVRA